MQFPLAALFIAAAVSAASLPPINPITVETGRQLGEVCGNGTFGSQCAGSLECFKPNVQLIGSPGYCVYPLKAEGESCGGSVAPVYQSRCGRGLTCARSTSGRMGAMGTCKKVEASTNMVHELGEICGGGARGAFSCAQDLECLHPTMLRGVVGYCLKPRTD